MINLGTTNKGYPIVSMTWEEHEVNRNRRHIKNLFSNKYLPLKTGKNSVISEK